MVHLRLLRHNLHRNMSVEGAIRQLRRHVSAFGRSAPIATTNRSTRGSSGGGGGGGGAVTYRHHAWLSRQYLTFGEVMGDDCGSTVGKDGGSEILSIPSCNRITCPYTSRIMVQCLEAMGLFTFVTTVLRNFAHARE